MDLKTVLVFGFCSVLFVVGDAQKLKISIYYETYCPCSVSFLSKQFYPTYKKLSEHLQVDLIPAGHTMDYRYNGTWLFSCKHGQQECYGNKVHGCILAHSTNQDQTMEFINCVVDGQYSDTELEYCTNATKIDWAPIGQCISGSLGDEILAAYSENVKAAGLVHIPAVIFNDVYDKLLDERARRGFLPTVCSLLKGKAPEICTNINMYAII